MRINNNIMALNTHRQYGIANAGLAGSSEKLSSGYRINRAGDDAAGLAISEKMRAQIRGLNMASKNSQDAISLVQTAEGALQETHSILQRMRELAVQSGSDTNNDIVDREALNEEFQQLINEIDDTANKTKFNNMGLIDGSWAGTASGPVSKAGLMMRAGGTEVTTHTYGVSDATANNHVTTTSIDVSKVEGLNDKANAVITATSDANGELKVSIGDTDYTATGIEVSGGSGSEVISGTAVSDNGEGQYEITLASADKGSVKVVLDKAAVDAIVNNVATGEVASAKLQEMVASSGDTGTYGTLTVETKTETVGGDPDPVEETKYTYESKGAPSGAKDDNISIDMSGIKGSYSADAKVSIDKSAKDGEITLDFDGKKFTATGIEAGAKSITFKNADNDDTITLNLTSELTAVTSADINSALFSGNDPIVFEMEATKVGEAGSENKGTSLTIQTGANMGDELSINIDKMDAETLGLKTSGVAKAAGTTIDISTGDTARKAIQTVDNAINKVSTQRSKLGALQNRLNHKINNLDTSSENLTAAESRIRDIDMAKEMSNYTKQNILIQASTSMLAQANQAPQNVLKLLG